MALTNGAGEFEEHQPFDMREDRSSAPQITDLVSPYGDLPVQLIYDEYPGGRPWLPPRGSRTSFVEAINAIANDLWALIVHQAHTDRFFKTDDTARVPSKKGPGMAAAIPSDTDVIDLQPNPKITESTNVLETFIKLWSVSEDLPVDEFLKRQVTTGAALKASERALMARREAQALLAPDDERMAYRKLRAVHNTHAGSEARPGTWDLPILDDGLSLEVEIGDVNGPTDARELQESHARSMALGSKSTIDLIMAETGAARHVAVKIYERVGVDRDKYPAPTNPGAHQSGPNLADVDATPDEIEEPQRGTSASVVANIKAS